MSSEVTETGGGGDDDAWLYGDESQGGPPVDAKDDSRNNGTEGPPEDAVADHVPNGQADEEGTKDQENIAPDGGDEEGEEEDEDSDEDDIEITIDKDKIDAAKTSYHTLQLKKAAGQEYNSKEKKGKFTVEEFDQIGTINGETAVDVDMESFADTPWRKPGADITDYFNYGFTEDTFAAYCARQRSLRVNEAGVSVMGNMPIRSTTGSNPISSIPIVGAAGGGDYFKKKLPLSSMSMANKVSSVPDTPSGISVITHERRIYSNKVMSNMDLSVPPPGGFSVPPPGLPPPVISSEPSSTPAPVAGDFPTDPFGETDPYAGGYEPTAEAQWSFPPPVYDTSLPPPGLAPYGGPPQDSSRYRRRESRPEDRERFRDHDRERRSHRSSRRSRSRERDRRDRDRHSDRDRDRERRVKKERRSRSGSPRHKKSRRDRDRRERGETPEADGRTEIKDEPAENTESEPPPPAAAEEDTT